MTDTDTTEPAEPTPSAPAGLDVRAPDYMSYSRMNSILTCGEQFRLERILKVPATEHWASIGGNAFHEAVEKLLKDEFVSLAKDAI